MTIKRNISFEALRVIFILFMVLHHLDSFNGIDIPSFTENIKKFCFEGFVGVNFFFMLSGLGCVLGYKDRLENKQIKARSFIYNRLAKLYPAYFLFLIFAIFLYSHGHIGNFKQLGMHLLMMQTFPISSNMAFGYNGVAWCISASFFFYLIFVAIHRIDFKECLGYIIFLLVFVGINILYHDNNGKVMTALFYTNPIFRLIDFLVGMAIALYFKKHVPICSSKLQLISIIIFMLFLVGGAYGNIPWIYKWGLYYVFPCALLLVSFYGETKLSQMFFGHRFWLSLSESSLIIFLSHQQFLNVIKIYLPDYFKNIFYQYFIPYGVLSSLLCIVVLSLIINKFYVQPSYLLLMKIKNKYYIRGTK